MKKQLIDEQLMYIKSLVGEKLIGAFKISPKTIELHFEDAIISINTTQLYVSIPRPVEHPLEDEIDEFDRNYDPIK